MAGTAGRHHARPAFSAGGSETHVESKPEARGACECSAANEAAQHVALALLVSVDLFCFPIAVRASQWLKPRGGIMMDLSRALVAATRQRGAKA